VRLRELERLNRTTKLAHSRFLLRGRSMRLSRGLRERCEQLHHSGALKDLLDEFALWTALWTGFPLTNELNFRKRALPAPSRPRIGQAAGGSMNDEGRAAERDQPRARARAQ